MKHADSLIQILGARTNNLKNISLDLPKDKLIVVVGLSGSGKSSLIMDTLYAEGQRRYVESLSSYARQFLDRMKKPDVDYIKGICPAIAIHQKTTTNNSRSTVGSMTEIYEYLRMLFARIGHTISPISGKRVKRLQVSDVVDFVSKQKTGTKIQLFTPLDIRSADREILKQLDLLLQRGFTRIRLDGNLTSIQDLLEDKKLKKKTVKDYLGKMDILVDRFVVNDDEENKKRIADSIRTAFLEGDGRCVVNIIDDKDYSFSTRFELDGIQFVDPTPQLFNYNNPFGACPTCEGFGKTIGIDREKIIPNAAKTLFDGAIAPWQSEKAEVYQSELLMLAESIDLPIHKPVDEFTKQQLDTLWNGKGDFGGIYAYFQDLEKKSYKIQNRIILSRYRGRTTCTTCNGKRLRPEALYVKVGGEDIGYLTNLPIDELAEFFAKVKLTKQEEKIAQRLLLEIRTRLGILMDVGLSYLTLDRVSSTLSGGESQRINLTRIIGSNLTDSLYILDEPSIGLHPRDTDRLISVLKKLRDLGNTVVVVEHEEGVIQAADHIIEIGPRAGVHGGEVVLNGDFKAFKNAIDTSITAQYVFNHEEIPIPKHRRTNAEYIKINKASEHNLQRIDVEIPAKTLSVITGVSGSGKSTLVKKILYPALKQILGETSSLKPGKHESVSVPKKLIENVELIDQNPIGRSSRSNPATYVNAYDAIRALMTKQPLSKMRGYKPKHFSFNVDGGRCETCQGDGEITIEMQFLADVKLTCDDCKGQKFKSEILEVKYDNKNIYDILNLTIEESLDFFQDHKDLILKLKPLNDVGLGYIKLGQSSSSLSGGEAQRLKLASYLGVKNVKERVLFIFDEPTTGLHFHDIHKLLYALNALVEKGHSVIVVEHNMEVIKSADYVVDLGPGGGKHGGKLLYQGPPEGLIQVKESYTGQFLKERMEPAAVGLS